jgi:hypothetical protein
MISRTETEAKEKKEKDIWEKLDVVFKAIAALAVAFVSVFGSMYLQGKAQKDAKVGLYVQLMTNRERSDSDLRKEMFNIVIKEFLEPKEQQEKVEERIKKRVLAVEMLTYNFHDVIALGPLFKQLDHDISEEKVREVEPGQKQFLLNRLRKVARETVDKQLAVLGGIGVFKNQDVFFGDLAQCPEGITVMDQELELPTEKGKRSSTRKFFVHVLGKDDNTKQLLVYVEISRPGEVRNLETATTFWLGFSDFPLIDNTRLRNGDRMAIVLRRWEENSAELCLAYFPGSRASLKDKVYYDELITQLLP